MLKIRIVATCAAFTVIFMMFSVSRAGGPDSWATRTSDPSPPLTVAGAVINGLIYIDGYQTPGPVLNIYNPATDSWTTGAAPNIDRAYSCTGVISGLMYVVGGCVGSDCGIGVTNALEIYDPVANSWSNRRADDDRALRSCGWCDRRQALREWRNDRVPAVRELKRH